MSNWSKDDVLKQTRARGVFFVSQTPNCGALRLLCGQLVREGLLASAGRRGRMLVFYMPRASNLAADNVETALAS
ncbi:hypothetical protein [Caulobacter sp. 1776]|uniref:hypothetical protein n=1 Tax=Caulobacter sp. 1776 TaxID=3156420 RepID=UPI00339ADF2B